MSASAEPRSGSLPKPMSRRIVFHGFAGLGAAIALAGCGGGDDSSGGGDSTSGGSDVDNGTELAKVSEIPVGGGMVLTSEKIVITQPTAGTFEAFSALCTHQGTMVAGVEDGVIRCEAHGSQFSAEDGAVTQGPATEALPKVAIKKQGDAIVKA